jgi:predicted phosphodiesterase
MRSLPEATPAETIDDKSKLFLRSLPATQEFQTQSGKLLLCHGLADNDMRVLKPDDYGYALQVNDELQDLIRQSYFRYVICGHTHHRMVRHFGNLTIINAGTLHEGHEPCVSIADFADNTVSFHNIINGSVEAAGTLITLKENLSR